MAISSLILCIVACSLAPKENDLELGIKACIDHKGLEAVWYQKGVTRFTCNDGEIIRRAVE